MNYLKVLGIILGLVAFLKLFYMHLLPWDENGFIEKFFSEERPPYIVVIALLGFPISHYSRLLRSGIPFLIQLK